MASLNKQQRVARNSQPAWAPEGAPLGFDDLSYSPEDYLRDLDEEDEIDDLDELLGPKEEAALADVVLQHFEEMKAAESVSRLEFLVTFLRGPLALATFGLGDSKNGEISTILAALLARYWETAHGIDPAVSFERMEQPDFISDFEKALDIVKQEAAEFLANENDLFDSPR